LVVVGHDVKVTWRDMHWVSRNEADARYTDSTSCVIAGAVQVTVYRVPLGRETRIAIRQTRLSRLESLIDVRVESIRRLQEEKVLQREE
jgi:hypothetical protein